MKKVLLPILLSLTLSVPGFSQISIDSADFGNLGDFVPVFTDTLNTLGLTVEPGSAQAQSWDYSMLNVHLHDTIVFDDTSNYANAGDYPGAQFVLPFALGNGFVQKTDSTMVILGLAGAGDDFGIAFPFSFAEPQTIINFPSTLGSSFTESNISEQTIPAPFDEVDSLIIGVNLQSFAECDAYGELKTPAGTYNETLRQYLRLDFVIDVTAVITLPIIGRIEQPVFDTSFSTHTYNFLAKESTYTILELSTDERDGMILGGTFQAGDKPLPELNVEQIECPGDTNGLIEVIQVVGGIPPYTYAWSNQSTQSEITDLSAGVYTLTVYDDVNDSSVTSVTISAPDSITVSESISAPSGSGLEDGSIRLDTVLGGTPPYSFNWDNGAILRNLEDVGPGFYRVTITDENNCSAEFTFEVPGAVNVEERRSNDKLNVYPVPVNDVLTISSGVAVKEITVFDASGTLITKKLVNQSNYQMDVSTFSPGFYLFRITDENDNRTIKRVIKN